MRPAGLTKSFLFAAALSLAAPAFAEEAPPAEAPAAPAAGEEKPAAEPMTRDQAAEVVLNKFMNALLIPDENKSAHEVMKYVHKSLYAKAGDDLSPDLRRFSFHKAHDNAKFYAVPVKVTRVRETPTSGIGFGPTAESGKVIDYFVAKKDGVGGMPAPVKVFFPANGGTPKVSYMGSL